MSRRFSELERQLIDLLAAGGNPQSLPAGSDLRSYADWKLNPTGPKRNLPASSTRNRQGQVGVIVRPFDIDGTAAETAATMSRRAALWLKGQSTSRKNSFRIVAPGAGVTYDVRENFVPARAIIRAKGAGSEQTSRITGRRYQSKHASSDQGYVIPFGRDDAGDTSYNEARTGIRSEFPANDFSVGFAPEKIGPSISVVDINALT